MTENRIEKIRAEVERLYNQSLEDRNRQADLGLKGAASLSHGKSNACKEILSFINTLEVKEVDLEKEYKDFVEEDPVYNKLVNSIVGKAIAKHFFELGLKAQKGE